MGVESSKDDREDEWLLKCLETRNVQYASKDSKAWRRYRYIATSTTNSSSLSYSAYSLVNG